MKSVELDIFTSADPQNLRASLVTTLGCTRGPSPSADIEMKTQRIFVQKTKHPPSDMI